MENSKSTKRALISSALAILMCVAMLIGTTFAWFTDTASTGVNKIQAGSLGIEVEYRTSLEEDWKRIDNATDLFGAEGTLFEPGHTRVVELKIMNVGNLALKYKIGMNVVSETAGTNKAGNPYKLSDYLKVAATGIQQYPAEGGIAEAMEWAIFQRGNVASWTPHDFADFYLEYAANGNVHSLLPGAAQILGIKVYMPESVGNEANAISPEKAASISFGLNVVATQYTVESDSFDNQYDKDAEYPIVAMDTLQELINNAAKPVSVTLGGNISGSLTVPKDKDVTLDLNGFTLTGGDSHAILNRGTLRIKDSSGNGKIVASKANTSALRNGDDAVCVIEGGTFTRAEAEGNKWHTVENFGTMTFNGGKVIAEDGQSFAIVNGWNYINPGEQKATMTINNIDMQAAPNGLKNCAGGILEMNGGTLHCTTGYWGLSNDSTGVATINGGKIISDRYIAISNGGAKMEINGGTFAGPQGSLYVQAYAKETVVKGGSYQNETVDFMQKYCPAGYKATVVDNLVVVSKN